MKIIENHNMVKTVLTRKPRKKANRRWNKKYMKRYSKVVPDDAVYLMEKIDAIVCHPSVAERLRAALKKIENEKYRLVPQALFFPQPKQFGFYGTLCTA